MHHPKTCEIVTRRISLSRVEAVGHDPKGVIIGWEYEPPKRGHRYVVYLGKGKVLRTSVVEDIRENLGSLLIKTANSIYKIQYLNDKS